MGINELFYPYVVWPDLFYVQLFLVVTGHPLGLKGYPPEAMLDMDNNSIKLFRFEIELMAKKYLERVRKDLLSKNES